MAVFVIATFTSRSIYHCKLLLQILPVLMFAFDLLICHHHQNTVFEG